MIGATINAAGRELVVVSLDVSAARGIGIDPSTRGLVPFDLAGGDVTIVAAAEGDPAASSGPGMPEDTARRLLYALEMDSLDPKEVKEQLPLPGSPQAEKKYQVPGGHEGSLYAAYRVCWGWVADLARRLERGDDRNAIVSHVAEAVEAWSLNGTRANVEMIDASIFVAEMQAQSQESPPGNGRLAAARAATAEMVPDD